MVLLTPPAELRKQAKNQSNPKNSAGLHSTKKQCIIANIDLLSLDRLATSLAVIDHVSPQPGPMESRVFN